VQRAVHNDYHGSGDSVNDSFRVYPVKRLPPPRPNQGNRRDNNTLQQGRPRSLVGLHAQNAYHGLKAWTSRILFDLRVFDPQARRQDSRGLEAALGDRYLRKLLVVGMTAVVRNAKRKPEAVDPNVLALLARKPARVVTVALANKTARMSGPS
jgi:hypothetical protein